MPIAITSAPSGAQRGPTSRATRPPNVNTPSAPSTGAQSSASRAPPAQKPSGQQHRQPGHELGHDGVAGVVHRAAVERGAVEGDPRRVPEGRGVLRDRQRPVRRDPGGEVHVRRRVELVDDELGVVDRLEDAERDRDRHQRPQHPARRRASPGPGRGAPVGRPGHRGDAAPRIRDDQRGKRQPEHDHRDGLEEADQQQREAGQQKRQEHQGGQRGQPPEEQPRRVPGIALRRVKRSRGASPDGGRLAVNGQ